MGDEWKNEVEKLMEVYRYVRDNGKVVVDQESRDKGRQITWVLGGLMAWRDGYDCGLMLQPDDDHTRHLIFRVDQVSSWRVADEMHEAMTKHRDA